MNINTLGLCKKAGKLIIGFDAVCAEMSNPATKAAGIILAADLSEKTKKELAYQLQKTNSKLKTVQIYATMDEIAEVLGKRTGIIAITDEGFFKAVTSHMK